MLYLCACVQYERQSEDEGRLTGYGIPIITQPAPQPTPPPPQPSGPKSWYEELGDAPSGRWTVDTRGGRGGRGKRGGRW